MSAMLRLMGWFFRHLLLGPMFVWPRAFWRRIYPRLAKRRWAFVMWIPTGALGFLMLMESYVRAFPQSPWAPAMLTVINPIAVVSNTPMRIVHGWIANAATGNPVIPITWAFAALAIVNMGTLVVYSTVFFGPLHMLGLRLWPQDPPAPDTTHGSAQWSSATEASNAGRVAPKGSFGGLLMGRLQEGLDPGLDPRYRVSAHTLTCAPTGAGKGIGCVIPNMLEYPGSVVCLDVKGENHAVTAGARRAMGQQVYCLDPFGITRGPSHRFNWLDAIDLSQEDCVNEAASLADTLVVRSREGDGHWDDAAAHLLQGLLLYTTSLPEAARHMGTLREVLTQPEPEILALLEDLAGRKGLGFGLVTRSANAFLAKADRERSGVLSTAQRHTAFLDDPRIVRSLSGTDFDFEQLKSEPGTVYLALPPDKLSAYNRYARATLGLALKAMLREPGRPDFNVLFLLDEFAQLGRFAPVEEGIAILRGYGVTLWLLVQDLSQLQAVYPKWRTFLANAVLQAFGTQDIQTARYVSEALGNQTIRVRSESTSRTTNHKWETSTSQSEGYNLHGRSLLTVDEVRRLPTTQVLVFEQGLAPIMLQRLNYLVDAESQGLAAPNPMFERAKPRRRPTVADGDAPEALSD